MPIVYKTDILSALKEAGYKYEPHPKRKTAVRGGSSISARSEVYFDGKPCACLLSAGLPAGRLDRVQPGRSREIGGLSAKRCSCFPERNQGI